MTDDKPPPRHAFAQRDFTLFWLSRVLGRLGIELQITGVSWHVYQLTGQAFDLGLVGLAQFAPFLVLFLIAGAAADRFQRARLLGFCIALQTACSILLYALTVTDAATFPRIFAVLLLLGISRAFQSPAQQAIVPLLIPKHLFANAVAWTASGTQLVRVSGPALAGGMLILGQDVAYGSAILCFAGATVLTFMIGANTQVLSRTSWNLSTLLGGFRFIWSRQVILGTIGLDLFAVLLGGATALLPIFAVDILQVGKVGFGILRAVHMAGAFGCALFLTRWPIQRHAGKAMLTSIVVFGAAIVVFGLSTSFYLSLAALFFMGAADAISVFIRSFVVQIITPDNMRGRVSAVNAVFIGASNELGEFESGITAAWWGVVPAVVIGGIGTVLVTLLFAWRMPQLRHIDSLAHDDLVRNYQ